MFINFSLYSFSTELRRQVSRFRQIMTGLDQSIQISRSLARYTTQTLMVGLLTVILWLGTAGTYTQPAQAGDNLDGRVYEAGPVRQSRNPISGENFNGGVEPSALERGKASQVPEEQAKGILENVIEAVQDVLPGQAAEENPGQASPSINLNTQKNPTLQRYGGNQQ
jgi:hypothetical protein